MGGAVSSGESNDELIDNLLEADYIKSPLAEKVFRAVDRGFYFTKPYRHNAYKDLAWKQGNLHISAPCIYCEVLENLHIGRGMSFLNIGSGTGYLSTITGLILGRNGINHGIEIHPDVVDYSRAKLNAFLKLSSAVDLFDFCQPCFTVGNGMDIAPTVNKYDRIYCGAACSKEEMQLVVDLLKVGGICVLPMNDSLVQIVKKSETRTEVKSLLPVSFANLLPVNDSNKKPVVLPEWSPPKLSDICRAEIRQLLRSSIMPPTDFKVNSEDLRRRKRKKKTELRNRRSNRLLVLRRGQEARNRGILAIEYTLSPGSSTDEHDSEDDHRSHYSNGRACKMTPSRNNADTDSDTPSLYHTTKKSSSSPLKMPSSSNQSSSAASSLNCQDQGSSNNASCSETPTKSRKRNSNGHHSPEPEVENNELSSEREDEEPPGRRPRTEMILQRIRELIRNRQRASSLLADNNNDVPMAEQPSSNPSNNQNGNSEVDHECIWSTDDSSCSSTSSSSTSTTSSSNNTNSDAEIIENIAAVPNVRDSSPNQGNENVVVVNDEHDEPEEPEGEDHNLDSIEVEVDSSPFRNAIRSIRFGLAAGGEEPMEGIHEEPSPVSIVQLEIDVLNEELSRPLQLQNHVSMNLMAKISQLNLPPTIKNYLNYNRNV